MIKPDHLAELLKHDAPLTNLSQAFDENLLLWYDEGKLRHTLRAWGAIARSRYRLFREDFRRDMARTGFRPAANAYRIRKIENASTGGIRRIKVTAVLRDPSQANDKQRIKEIVKAVVKEVSNVSVRTDPSGLEKRWSRSGSASYIWISLYKVDGSLRWLGSRGWQSGNLLAVAEKVRKRKLKPVLVPKPEEIWCGIRLQYTMDVEAYLEAMNNLVQGIEQIN